MKTLSKLFLAILFAAAAAQAFAQDSRVGYINSQRILTESAPAKLAMGKLEQEFGKRQKEVSDLQASLKSFGEKLERDAPTLTDTQKVVRRKEGEDLNRELQRKQRDLADDTNARRNEETLKVYALTDKALKQVAEQEKYDLILQEGVAYNNGKHDVTDKVLKILNASK